jgi:hypothetical protein
MSDFQNLRTAWRKLIEEVVRKLENFSMPMRPWRRIVRPDANTYSFPEELRPDVSTLVVHITFMSENLASMDEVAEAIAIEPTLAALVPPTIFEGRAQDKVRYNNWVLNYYVIPFLGQYLAAVKQIVLDEDAVGATSDQFLLRITSPVDRYVSLSPLQNLDLDTDEVQIAPNIRLRRPTISELETWLNYDNSFHGLGLEPIEIADLRAVIEVEARGTTDVPLDTGSLRSVPDRLVDLLRLVTNGNVFIAFTEHHSSSVIEPLHPRSTLGWNRLMRGTGASVSLGKDAARAVVALWPRMHNSPNLSRIALALRRWSDASLRLLDEDKLIDYWIGLESLFTKGTSSEIRFRASLRIAAYLGKSAVERTDMYAAMRHSYDWRSSIVHGDAAQTEKLTRKEPLSSTAAKTRLYLRDTILRLLESNEVFDPQIIELELLGT